MKERNFLCLLEEYTQIIPFTKYFDNNKTYRFSYISMYSSTKTGIGILMALRACHSDFPSRERVERSVIS